MAASDLKGCTETLEDFFQCQTLECCLICLETYDKPTQLQCHHIFCERCLCHYGKIYGQTQGRENGTNVSISCPICRQQTSVPEIGIAGLKHSLSKDLIQVPTSEIQQRCDSCSYNDKTEDAAYYCNKCFLNFCQACKTTHQSHTVFSSHSVIHISNRDSISLFCALHGQLPSVYYCNDCNIPACAVCVIQLHSKHNNTRLSEALSMMRDNLKDYLNNLGPKIKNLAVKLRKLSHDFSSHREGQSGSEASMNHAMSSINGEPKPELIQMKVRKDCNDNAESEIRVIEREIKKLQMLYDLVSKSLEMSQSKKLLVVYDNLLSRLETVIETEHRQLQDITLKIERELENSNLESGSQTISSSLSSPSLHRRSMSLAGTSTKSSPDHSQLSLDGGTLEDETDHFMLFKPKLTLKIEKTRVEELWNPADIAFHPSSNFIVAEYDVVNEKNNCLRLYNSNGTLKSKIGAGLLKPLGVAVNRDGNIAATDCAGKRVKIFTPDGHMALEFGKGSFGWPYGITCNSKGEYIVSDTFHDTISIFSRDGRKVKTFGSSGSGSNQFRNPFHLTVDACDNIVISDYGNRCIKVFDIRGEFMNVYLSDPQRRQSTDAGKGGKKRRKLKGPRGVAVDIRGNTLVADDSGKICLFDSKGMYVRNLLTDEDTVKYPEALATNKNGYLAITEWNTHNMFAIKMFHMYE